MTDEMSVGFTHDAGTTPVSGLPVIHSISRALEAALLIENQQSGTIYFYFAECRV